MHFLKEKTAKTWISANFYPFLMGFSAIDRASAWGELGGVPFFVNLSRFFAPRIRKKIFFHRLRPKNKDFCVFFLVSPKPETNIFVSSARDNAGNKYICFPRRKMGQKMAAKDKTKRRERYLETKNFSPQTTPWFVQSTGNFLTYVILF